MERRRRGKDDIRVAIIDSGIDFKHEDAPINIDYVDSYSVIDPTKDPQNGCNNQKEYDEGKCTSHGVALAGIVAANTNNEAGIAGYSYNTTIIPIQDHKGIERHRGDSIEAFKYAMGETTKSGDTISEKADVILFAAGPKKCPSLDEIVDPRSVYGQTILRAVEKYDIPVILAVGNAGEEGCEVSQWDYLAGGFDTDRINGIILVGAYRPVEENGRVKATRAPYSNKSDGLTLLGPGGYFRGGAFKPPFLNALLSTINTKLRAHSDSVFKLLENTQGYDYVEGTSYAAAFIASLVALMKRVNPNLSAKKIEEILCDSSIDDEIVEGYDNLHGCGLVDPISALEMAEEARSQSVVAISKPRIINLGNFYDQDNQKPFKIVVKNIGGGKFGQLTKENILFRTPFKKVSVDIDNEKSWLKLTEIKTIKPQQEFELTFKFDRSSINKYIINKNPDKVFIGDLIIVPEGVKEELIIPVYVFGGKEVYEKITEPISILVYEKDEFETKINPQPIYTTTPNENLEFELPELDNNKEYRVIATTDKNWWSGTAGKEFYWGQIIIKKGSLEPKTLTIYISKYKK